MKQSVTIKDIASMAGVSVATVSRYLNNSGYIDASTAARIAAMISEADYRPSRTARSLKTHSSKNIMLVVPDISNPFYSEMASIINLKCRKIGYTVTLYNTGEAPDQELQALRLARDISADGIVFASVTAQDAVIAEAEKSRVPIVMVNSYDKCRFDSIHGSRYLGTYLATKHLIDLGHRRICFAGGIPGSVIAESRKRGYMMALEEVGIPLDDSLIFEMGFNIEAGKKAGRYFSALSPWPTAVCCANDMVALGVIGTFNELGILVPQDVSVTGMDNTPYSAIFSPQLTTVTNDSTEFGELAINALFERIDGKYDGPAREYVINRALVVRSSTRAIDQ